MSKSATDQNLFNIDLVTQFDAKTMNIRQITTGAIFEPSSPNFNQNGLFSTSIFGPVGSDIRNETVAYIDLRIPILHPMVYNHILNLKRSYEEILSGKAYVEFDKELGDFIPVPQSEGGKTGYEYFITHLEKIKFKETNSEERKFRIALVEKYRTKDNWIDKFIVIPAGLREYTVDSSGTPSEDAINGLYRTLLSSTGILSNINFKDMKDLSSFDGIRIRIQKAACDIYDHILNLLDGKSKFIQAKWTTRAIVNGTRNVITPSYNNVTDLKQENPVTVNHTICGLYQYCKAMSPIAMNRLHSQFINKIFNPESNKASIVNAKTLKYELIDVDIRERDQWLSMDGINSIMNKLGLDDMVDKPIYIGKDHYLLLIEDLGDRVNILYNNNEVEAADKKSIRPITYGELFYLAVVDTVKKYSTFVTRYPVVALGGIYPSKIYLKTTVKGRMVTYRNGMSQNKVYEYPILNTKWWRSISPHMTTLGGLVGDFDGDSVIGSVYVRFDKKIYKKIIPLIKYKGVNMSIKNRKVIYNYGIINLEDFPREELIKVDGNKEFYSVPNGIEVLTVWDGVIKWVKPESYSIHKNLQMFSVRTRRGDTIECSDEHSIVTLDTEFNYIRANPKPGMVIPKIRNGLNTFINSKNYKRTITSSNTRFNLDFDLGYFFGAIIGDGWVNPSDSTNPNAIMLATTYTEIKDKITNVLTDYGYNSNPYSKENPHEFDGRKSFSIKHTWYHKGLSKLLRDNIGHLAENKKLPDWWGNTPEKFRWGLLSGLLDTDGTFTEDKRGINCYYSTASRRLAFDFIALVNSLGGSCGLTVHKRPHKTKLEYTCTVSALFGSSILKNCKLYNNFKRERLVRFGNKIKDQTVHNVTPNIKLEKLVEILAIVNKKLGSSHTHNIRSALVRAKMNNNESYLTKPTYDMIINNIWDDLKDDKYWQKLKDVMENENVVFDVISNVIELPEITEAYDLTAPPFSTFVIQNGIVVYDTVSFNTTYTEDSIKEIDDKLNDINFYIYPDDSIIASNNTDYVELVIKHMAE